MAGVDLDVVLDCLKRMEEPLFGLKQVRALLPGKRARAMLDVLIVEAEQNIAEIKRKVIQ